MTDKNYTPAPPADFILAFDLAQLGLRGRVVRLDAVSARALGAHQLPEPSARVLGETLVLSALLGSALKLDGRLTVQTKSDGALNLVTADYYGAEGKRPAGLRGFARMTETQFAKPPGFFELAGSGVLAITIEPRRGGQTYQGIVELSANGIAPSAETYFAQSEQLPTAIRLAAAPAYVPGRSEPNWRAGGIMLQAMPQAARVEDDWERLSMILNTVDAFELLDNALSAETLLWRLFHEDEVRVHPAEQIAFRCDCDTARIASVLRSYSAQQRDGLADGDGIIRARCEFCATVHEIGADALT